MSGEIQSLESMGTHAPPGGAQIGHHGIVVLMQTISVMTTQQGGVGVLTPAATFSHTCPTVFVTPVIGAQTMSQGLVMVAVTVAPASGGPEMSIMETKMELPSPPGQTNAFAPPHAGFSQRQQEVNGFGWAHTVATTIARETRTSAATRRNLLIVCPPCGLRKAAVRSLETRDDRCVISQDVLKL